MARGDSVIPRSNVDGQEIFRVDIKRAVISASSSGANAIVAAVTGKKIKVLGCYIVASNSVNVKFQSASTDITGLAYLTTNSGFVLPSPTVAQNHWFETAAGEALNLNLSGNVAVGGAIIYYEEE